MGAPIIDQQPISLTLGNESILKVDGKVDIYNLQLNISSGENMFNKDGKRKAKSTIDY